jgi:hypothetical protein
MCVCVQDFLIAGWLRRFWVESLQFWHDPSSWQMMLETTNIHQKEVKISSEVGKKSSSNSYFQRRKCDVRSVAMT